jgi:hypothetical protein
MSAIKWCAGRRKLLSALHADVNDPEGHLGRPTAG